LPMSMVGCVPARTTIKVAASFGLTSSAVLSRYSPGPAGVVPYCCLIVGDAGYANPDATEFGLVDPPHVLAGKERRGGGAPEKYFC
jgi:hypothetical protein